MGRVRRGYVIGDYLKELEALQRWTKAAANINSMRLSAAPPKVARPVILWEGPDRLPGTPLDSFSRVYKVSQYGKLYVSSAEEMLRITENLESYLRENCYTLPVLNNGAVAGLLKNVELTVNTTDGVDVPIKVKYEVTYSRTLPADPGPAVTVGNKITLNT